MVIEDIYRSDQNKKVRLNLRGIIISSYWNKDIEVNDYHCNVLVITLKSSEGFLLLNQMKDKGKRVLKIVD